MSCEKNYVYKARNVESLIVEILKGMPKERSDDSICLSLILQFGRGWTLLRYFERVAILGNSEVTWTGTVEWVNPEGKVTSDEEIARCICEMTRR
jgi:hypothetical protein